MGMEFKCTPQLIGLTREPKPSGNHRANGGDIAWEAGNERASKSDTLDRDWSYLNEYEGYSSGKECWEAICEEADEYRSVYKDKNGKEHSRKLRSDAVVGWAVVIKPPCFMCAVWTPEEVDQFREDMWECLCELEPRLFRKDNIRMKATHRDEGLSHNGLEPHDHIIGVSRDQDGNFCGNLIDSMLYQKINAQLPAMMRDRGWKDMQDLDTTDWNAYNNDESYREKRTAAVKQKKVEQSQNVNRFIEQRRTAVLKDANAVLAEANKEKELVNGQLQELQEKKEEQKQLETEIQEKQKTNKQLDDEIQEKQIKHKHVNRELQQKQEEQKQLEKEIQEKRANAEKEIQAEKEKQLKTMKDRLLVDYTYSRDLHDEAAEKAIMASEKINGMSAIDMQNAFYAHLKAHNPDLYAELKNADAEYKNELKKAVMVPEMPAELTNMNVLNEVVKDEHDRLKAVQAEDAKTQKLASDLEAENEKLRNRQTVKIEKTVKLVDAEEVQNDANEFERILQNNAVPEKDRSL